MFVTLDPCVVMRLSAFFHLLRWEAVWEWEAAVALITSPVHTHIQACTHTHAHKHTPLLPTPNSYERRTSKKIDYIVLLVEALFKYRD